MVTEAGLVILNEEGGVIASQRFGQESLATSYSDILNGQASDELKTVLSHAAQRGVDLFIVSEGLKRLVEDERYSTETKPPEFFDELRADRPRLMVEAGLASSEKEAIQAVRQVSLALSEERIRSLSEKLDFHAIQSVQCLDETDKAINLLSSRLREWYGLHFPELSSLIDEPTTHAKVAQIGLRDALTREGLVNLGLTQEKVEAILERGGRSKGGAVRIQELKEISMVAEEILRLTSLRQRLAKHVEEIMKSIAPNLVAMAGATIGARLIAKAGSLERLARMPASTIQVLGAEKALFRALRTGSRPPKHGILFQHQAVHSAPRWQRGKVARSLAGKIAIAARIDAFRGAGEEDLLDALQHRLKEIRMKTRPEPTGPRPQSRRKAKRGRGERRR